MPDPMFRQRLRSYHLDLRMQMQGYAPGSPERFDCERAISAVSRLYGTLYKEGIDPIHSGPPPGG